MAKRLTSHWRHTFARANGKWRNEWVRSLGVSCELNVGHTPCDMFVVKCNTAVLAHTHTRARAKTGNFQGRSHVWLMGLFTLAFTD